MEKTVSKEVWFHRYIPEISAEFSQADAKKRVRLFEGLEKAVDGLEKAKVAEKIAVSKVLETYAVSDMETFMSVFVPDAKSGLWPMKQDGTRLTPQAVALRVQGDKLDGLSDFAVAACLYLRALERGVRRLVAKAKAKGKASEGQASEGQASKSKGADTMSQASLRHATLQAQIGLLDTIVQGIVSSLGKADAATVLSAVIAECQQKAQTARLELLKLQGKAVAPEQGKKAKAIKIFA